MNKEGNRFLYLISKLSEANLKEEIFLGPQRRTLMKGLHFDKKLTDKELDAWLSLKAVIKGFLDNHRTENAEQLVNDM